MNNIHII